MRSMPSTARYARIRHHRLVTRKHILETVRCFCLTGFCTSRCSRTAGSGLSIPLVASTSIRTPSPRMALRAVCRFVLSSLGGTIRSLPMRDRSVLRPGQTLKCNVLTQICLSVKSCSGTLGGTSLTLRRGSRLFG